MEGSNKTANFGPWIMSDSACDAWEIPAHEGRTSSSCHSIVDDDGEVVAFAVTSYNDWDNPTKEAQLTDNARLIATAPELLEFIREWLDRQGGDANYMTEKASALIAKATS